MIEKAKRERVNDKGRQIQRERERERERKREREVKCQYNKSAHVLSMPMSWAKIFSPLDLK